MENDVGVTISIDGPREMQDKFRVFHNGAGSYDVVAPKIKELLRRHRSRPIGARVTLTSGTLDITRIYRHLTEEIGFGEVGFAPVTTSPDQQYAIGDHGFDSMLGQFRVLAPGVARARRRQPASRLLERQGIARRDSQGREQGVPVRRRARPARRLDRRRRRAVPSVCRVGRAQARARCATASIARHRSRFSQQHHIADKTDCRKCWARPLCSGGCYHEAHVRYGTTTRPNLHYCEWIRGWTDTCLQVYGELSERNPAFLARFDRDEVKAEGGLIVCERAKLERQMQMTPSETHQPESRSRGRARRPAEAGCRCAAAARRRGRTSDGVHVPVLAGLGSRSGRRHRRALHSRSSATSSTATSAVSGRRRCRTAQSLARTGRQMRGGPEGLAQDRPRVSMTRQPNGVCGGGSGRAQSAGESALVQ